MGRESVVYITYDGVLTSLGQSQVLTYLERLSDDYDIQLVSFEKREDTADLTRLARMRERLRDARIRWTRLRYHKTPTAPATAYDIARGTAAALQLTVRHRARILHTRSYVPAVMALPVQQMTRAKLLFDMRGFWADERVEGGIWPNDSVLYKAAKATERRLLRSSNHIITLTHASAETIKRFDYLEGRVPPITVIPTCADLDRFTLRQAPPSHPFVFGYVGSVGTWYRFEEVLRIFEAILRRRSDARMLVINKRQHDDIRAAVAKVGIDQSLVELLEADHGSVHEHVMRMHAGAAIYKPGYARIATAPTKLAEYLGCGVACVSNTGVGDVEAILKDNEVGTVLRDFSDDSVDSAAQHLVSLVEDPSTRNRCAATAHRLFSVGDGVEKYTRTYERLLSSAA